MSKVLKDAKGWLKDVDESACFCEMGVTANGKLYHTLECVQTSAHIIRKLVEALELAEQKRRPTKRAPDVACTSCKLELTPQCPIRTGNGCDLYQPRQ